MKKIFELRKNKRVQRIVGNEAAAPSIVSSMRENISFESGTECPECAFCGAMLPRDTMFQKAHMMQVHGLIA